MDVSRADIFTRAGRKRRFGTTRMALALAACGLCGAAHAQSSVTLYGALDGGLRNLVNGTKAGGAALTAGAGNGTFYSNRWGILGKEDLGGGYYARFNLESGFVLGNGQFDNTSNQIFERTSTVGLGGPFGVVDIGRQFTLQHKTAKDFEPFDYNYLGITEAPAFSGGTSGRDSNDINYTGVFGPWVARLEYVPGGVAGSLSHGTVLGAGANYHTGPFKFGAAYTRRWQTLTPTGTSYFADDQYLAGGAVRVGPVEGMAGFALNMQDTPMTMSGKTRNQYIWGGVRYDISPVFNATAAYYHDRNTTDGVSGRKDVAILGLLYSLSKRTRLYADVDYTKFTGIYLQNSTLNPSGHASQTGVSVGINHFF